MLSYQAARRFAELSDNMEDILSNKKNNPQNLLKFLSSVIWPT